MGTDIAKKIAEYKPKLTKKERQANRESVQRRAGELEEKAFQELGKLLSDKNTPASTKKGAIDTVFDRIAGRPKLVDEKQTEQSQLEKMSFAELVEYITQQMSGLPLPVRAVLGESIAEGIEFDAADLADLAAEVEMKQPAPAEGLPPLERKPRKEPRR